MSLYCPNCGHSIDNIVQSFKDEIKIIEQRNKKLHDDIMEINIDNNLLKIKIKELEEENLQLKNQH